MKLELNIKKNKKVKFFELDEVENIKEGVLLLESQWFKIVKISISKVDDERERELEIDEKLEDEIEGYDSFYYLSKEITLYEDDEIERVIVIMLEKDRVYTLLENIKSKRIKLLGIYPLFFMEFFNCDGKVKSYLEIDDDRTRVFTFSNNKFIDFQDIELEKEEILSNLNYIDEYLEDNSLKFVYPDQSELREYIENLEIRDWREYNSFLKEEYDYLPEDYKKELKYLSSVKVIMFMLSVVIIIGTIFFITINLLTDRKRERLGELQKNYVELKNKNLTTTENIRELEDEIKKLREESREREFKKIKISKIYTFLFENSDGIRFEKLEYDGEKIIGVDGIAETEEEIYNYQHKVLASGYFKNINQDFIKLEEKLYRFKMEFEIDYGKD